MTTIAATTRMMAADSRCTIGDTCFPTTKLLRINGGIVGAAGLDSDCQKFIQFVMGKAKAFSSKQAFNGLFLCRKGLFTYDCRGMKNVVKDGYYAIGNGADLAMGSLATMNFLGVQMDPRLAVLVACERDVHSGPPVDFLTLRA